MIVDTELASNIKKKRWLILLASFVAIALLLCGSLARVWTIGMANDSYADIPEAILVEEKKGHGFNNTRCSYLVNNIQTWHLGPVRFIESVIAEVISQDLGMVSRLDPDYWFFERPSSNIGPIVIVEKATLLDDGGTLKLISQREISLRFPLWVCS